MSGAGTAVTATASDPLEVVARFNDAFARHDVEGVMAMMTDDCLFEDTRPAPDGTRFRGQEDVRERWETFFRRSPQARFEQEDAFASQDRCVVLWRYDWVRDGRPGRVRGVDVFRVEGGKVAEKLSYVKG